MKKLLLSLLLVAIPLLASAQAKYGFFSYGEVFRAMPEYSIAERNLTQLQSQFEDEMKRAEEEFNKKYEEFLEGMQEFATPIRQKRQAELQELMEKNLSFKQEAQRLLEAARRDAYLPIKEKLMTVVKTLGAERGYAFILNTDNDTCPYLDPAVSEDITPLLKDQLK
ncbi:MAG: OmpH family outer membrane protein [Prevotella sp.]|nr:OmpH family outer membrane protein [Prevotella sp.]